MFLFSWMFFDIYTIETCKLLYFLCCFYDNVYINKPLTSRPANSEKYIVCKGFKGIDYTYLDEICKILNIWCNIEDDNHINDIFSNNLPQSFIDKIRHFNEENTKYQIKNIQKTLDLIEEKKNLSMLSLIIENQVKKAKEWCNMYNMEVNLKSNFIQRYT